MLDAGIRKIDDTHYEVKRSALDEILANPMAFLGGARVVPAMKHGQPEGFKLYAVRPGALFDRLGLRNGDTLKEIDGHAVHSPDKALEIYSRLRSAQQITLLLARRGGRVVIAIKITK